MNPGTCRPSDAATNQLVHVAVFAPAFGTSRLKLSTALTPNPHGLLCFLLSSKRVAANTPPDELPFGHDSLHSHGLHGSRWSLDRR